MQYFLPNWERWGYHRNSKSVLESFYNKFSRKKKFPLVSKSVFFKIETASFILIMKFKHKCGSLNGNRYSFQNLYLKKLLIQYFFNFFDKSKYYNSSSNLLHCMKEKEERNTNFLSVFHLTQRGCGASERVHGRGGDKIKIMLKTFLGAVFRWLKRGR